MNGPCLRPSGSLLLPYFSSGAGHSASRPAWTLLSSRRSTSSAARACQAVEPLWGVTFTRCVHLRTPTCAQFPVPGDAGDGTLIGCR